jgi:DNA-3-methyladenine glycosylase
MEKSLTSSPEKSCLAASQLSPLPKSFYLRDSCVVARELLGKGLVVKLGRDWLVLEIVEVEAYKGAIDPASHAFRGPTPRNWPMFEEGGTCYVYLSYGINYCMNVSTGPKGKGEAVLLRAGRPVSGLEVMQTLRNMPGEEVQVSNGPGKLTQAMGIGPKHNGLRYDLNNFKLVDLGSSPVPSVIGTSPRIGISKATDKEFRFFVKNSPWLSRKGPIVYKENA